jgi:hypothetical protein
MAVKRRVWGNEARVCNRLPVYVIFKSGSPILLAQQKTKLLPVGGINLDFIKRDKNCCFCLLLLTSEVETKR